MNKRTKTFLALFVLLLASAPSPAADTIQERNTKTVLAFYDAAINQKDFSEASRHLGQRYRQHNPNAADGPAGLEAYVRYLRERFPRSHSEIKRVFADGDFVILHVHAVRVPGTRGNAIVDIFRLENGKVAEHWDVIQEIPESAANSNGMF